MSECPECGMRDDDWFLCRREPCVAINRAVTDAAEASAAEIARLQEQVETLRKERDQLQKIADSKVVSYRDLNTARAEAAEVEQDRLRALLEGRDKFIVDQGLWPDFVWSLPAALQKEPQP